MSVKTKDNTKIIPFINYAVQKENVELDDQLLLLLLFLAIYIIVFLNNFNVKRNKKI